MWLIWACAYPRGPPPPCPHHQPLRNTIPNPRNVSILLGLQDLILLNSSAGHIAHTASSHVRAQVVTQVSEETPLFH